MKFIGLIGCLLLLGACRSYPDRNPLLAPYAVEVFCRVDGRDYILAGTFASPQNGRPTCSSFWLIPERDYWAKVVIHHNYIDASGYYSPAGTWIEEVTFADGLPPLKPVKGRVYLVPERPNNRQVQVLVEHLPDQVNLSELLQAVTTAGVGKIVIKKI